MQKGSAPRGAQLNFHATTYGVAVHQVAGIGEGGGGYFNSAIGRAMVTPQHPFRSIFQPRRVFGCERGGVDCRCLLRVRRENGVSCDAVSP